MPETAGIASGSRLALIGGGVAAWSLAASLSLAARARGRAIDVKLFAADQRPDVAPPALLTAECRARLAALGALVPPEWRALEVSGIEVSCAGASERLPRPAGGLWVVDGPCGGLARVTSALAAVAFLNGVKLVPRRVDRVERVPEGASPKPPGELMVWAQGAPERFHAAALACGPRHAMEGRFFPQFDGAPTLPAVQGWLKTPGRSDGILRLLIAPTPGVWGLYLVPSRGRTYALAFGENVGAADFCAAVMIAGRQRQLPEDLELESIGATRVPAGAGSRLTARGQIAVGPCAWGHPLQIGISETLAASSRAALALVSSGDRAELARRYVREAVEELGPQAVAGASAVRWLTRAGPRGPRALARARERHPYSAPFNGGILGLPSPAPPVALGAARGAALAEGFIRLFFERVPKPPAPRLPTEVVYVVEDDGASREALCAALESHGTSAQPFADELALLGAVERRRPKAILLDVVLKWVDGLRLCEALKRRAETKEIPVFVMSGLDRPFIRERALAAGAEAFLAKPIELGALLTRLGLSANAPRIEPTGLAS